jgi:hypothetical protein
VSVGRFRDDSLRWLCGFNDSVSAREERRWDKALSEDEVDVARSSCLNGKEA